MNTTDIQLNDGKTILAHWSQSFAKAPTIGDTVTLDPSRVVEGYRNQAVVTKIEIDGKTHVPKLILEAAAANSAKTQRPVIFLNEDYIPAALRQDVENHLKSRFDLPVFDWVRSLRTTPITEIHHPGDFTPAQLDRLKNEIRELVLRASDLVVR